MNIINGLSSKRVYITNSNAIISNDFIICKIIPICSRIRIKRQNSDQNLVDETLKSTDWKHLKWVVGQKFGFDPLKVRYFAQNFETNE